MTDGGHVRAFRLFDCVQAGAVGEPFSFLEWEGQHLHHCAECQELLELLGKQFTRTLPLMPSNGEINSTDGYYRSVCCGLEIYVPAGAAFPDCRRHKSLSTIWKPVTSKPGTDSTNRGKQGDSAA
jgi:hypothetical protein